MTTEQADRMAELLSKLVRLQRRMKVATPEQRTMIFEVADKITDELVENYDGDRTWCNALLTFGGQYFAQNTIIWIGDSMSDATVLESLREEVYRRYGLPWKEEEETVRSSQDSYLEKGAKGALGDSQQQAYNFYHYDEIHDKAK